MSGLLGADMTVNSVALVMVALGIGLFTVTLRFWRSAGEDPEALAPLEVMGDRRFARADLDERVDLLNAVRPPGAARPDRLVAPRVLEHEPLQQERPRRDSFDHSDDAVDVVPGTPAVIDPLLSRATGGNGTEKEE